MKQSLFILLFFVIIYSCKKYLQPTNPHPGFLQQIKTALKDSLSGADYNNLAFEKALLSGVDSLDINLLRVPFKNKDFKNDFLVLKTNKEGTIIKGKIIQLSDNQSTLQNTDQKNHFNGNISISSLNRQTVLHSKIQNGYIEAFHQQQATFRTLSMADPYETLPEVIVVAYITPVGISYNTWASLFSIMDGGSGSDNYYNDLNYTYGGGGGGGGSTGGSTGTTGSNSGDTYIIQTVPLYLVDMETQIKKPAIDIQKFLKCFSNVPDAGATYSIEIFTDIPVDDEPNALFSWQNESPGHTFIQLKKKNGASSVVQNIGFYPVTEWKSILSPLPINGKFVDNGGHEMNASLLMNLAPENFQRTINQIAYVSSFVKYDIDEYNCTEFALEIFNTTRSKKIEIPKYSIPGGETPFGTSTPQGLYQILRKMKNSNDAEAANVSLPGVKGWVTTSTGPCN